MCFPPGLPIRGKLLPTPGSGGFGPRQRKEAEPSSVQDADFILPIKARKKTATHTQTHTGTPTRGSMQAFALGYRELTGHVAAIHCASVP